MDASRLIRSGDRAALARAITLVESTRTDHRGEAVALLNALLPYSGRAVRIGITGVPGVGKSTFIEAFGLHLLSLGHRLAVLAVDPSSKRSGGSILGDKTRMERLAREPSAFIRPSPAGQTLGGVARRTREAIVLCEAAGFDVVIVETVGVGQSETAVAEMVDVFVLLLPPAGGDELQGLKKGIVELADILVVNKSDGALAPIAERSRADYAAALHLLRPRDPAWSPPVLTCSALENRGLAAVWASIETFRIALSTHAQEGRDRLTQRRAEQARAWLQAELEDGLRAALEAHPIIAARLPEVERAVVDGTRLPSAAAGELMAMLLGHAGGD